MVFNKIIFIDESLNNSVFMIRIVNKISGRHIKKMYICIKILYYVKCKKDKKKRLLEQITNLRRI